MSKKKAEQQTNIDLTDVQKRMDQYVKACEKEKKGKITALSMIGVTIVCLLILLIVGLKLSGVGFTVVADGSSGQVTVVDSADVSGTNLADTVTK
ncbi:MAG: hypothetical protein ACI4IM_06905 [Acutalibacteraceae bacterium]